jgi:hypothetical protein
MTPACYDVAVVGVERAENRLAAAGVTDIVVLDDGLDLSTAAFDVASHTWTLPTCRARIVVTDQVRRGRENVVPYLGVAMHGVPNYFTITGDDDAVADARLDYIADLLALMRRSGSTRIEVLFSTQRAFHNRRAIKPDPPDPEYWARMMDLAPSSYDLSSGIGIADDVYDGTATIRSADDALEVRVRLSGHFDPIDGRYHWQGTIFTALPDGLQARPLTLTIGAQTADCRITERTQQGGYSVAGVGAPPYVLDDIEVVVPR